MAKGFIKNNWQKDATNTLVDAALRGGGGMAAAFVTQKVFTIKKTPEGTESRTLYNIGGPLVVAVGVLGDMMLQEPKLKAICQGMTTYGLMHSLAVLSPESIAPALGIQGLAGTTDEEAASLTSAVGALGETTNAYSTTENPPEFAQLTAGQPTTNDGNDWAYLANNIQHAEQITKTVDGVTAESEAAALMGVTSEEEAAVLMGMF